MLVLRPRQACLLGVLGVFLNCCAVSEQSYTARTLQEPEDTVKQTGIFESIASHPVGGLLTIGVGVFVVVGALTLPPAERGELRQRLVQALRNHDYQRALSTFQSVSILDGIFAGGWQVTSRGPFVLVYPLAAFRVQAGWPTSTNGTKYPRIVDSLLSAGCSLVYSDSTGRCDNAHTTVFEAAQAEPRTVPSEAMVEFVKEANRANGCSGYVTLQTPRSLAEGATCEPRLKDKECWDYNTNDRGAVIYVKHCRCEELPVAGGSRFAWQGCERIFRAAWADFLSLP